MKNLLFLCCFFSLGFNNCLMKTTNIMNELDDLINLQYGKSAIFEKETLEITFLEFIDSRCPRKTQCITEGEATIKFKIQKENKSEIFEMNIKGLCFDESGICGSENVVMGYKLKLFFLSPYPETKIPDKKKYKVRLTVSRVQ